MGTRLTGLSSGLDIDSMVKSLLTGQQAKVDNAKKALQYAEWQQEAYRAVIKDIVDFQETFFDILKKDTYIMSSSNFNAYTAAASISGASTSAVSVSATSSAMAGTHTISNITRALKDTWAGTNTASLVSSGLSLEDINNGDTIDITIDGVKKTIILNGGYSEINDLVSDLQGKIDAAFGAGKASVGASGEELSFTASGHVLELTDTNKDDTVLTSLGFTTGDRNVLNKRAVLGDANFTNDIFAGGDTISFRINDEVFTFDKTGDTVQNIIDKVNNSTAANVTLSYSELTNSFTLVSDSEGAANQIVFEDITGSFLSSGIGINYAENTGRVQAGSDAVFTLDGVTTTRSSNTFTVDGVKYVLNSDTTSEITVNVSKDTSNVKDKIKNFVEKYNELVDTVNDLLKEKKDRDFSPLTEEQKKEMSEDEIKKWEEKAKSGLLKNDSLLSGFLSSMRSTLFSTTGTLGINLMDYGITTSKDYSNGGKLVINEEKLDAALESNPDGLTKLFTDSESGLGVKMKSVLDKYVKKTGVNKGLLIQKAGMEGTTAEGKNYLSDKIKSLDKKADTLLKKLQELEDKYYMQFSQMESALANMNAMSTYVSGWFMK